MRLCIDCKTERGLYEKNHRFILYSSRMIASHKRSFPTAFERYFPGLFSDLIPPREERIWRYGSLWMLAMSRCPGCKAFKEAAKFPRCVSRSPPRSRNGICLEGEIITGPAPGLCSLCFAKEFGSAALQERLAGCALALAEAALDDIHNFLKSGWMSIIEGNITIYEPREPYDISTPKNRFAVKACRIFNPDALEIQTVRKQGFELEERDMEGLHTIHAEIVQFLEHQPWAKKREARAFSSDNFVYDPWGHAYEEAEGSYRLFKKIIRRIKESPEIVLRHAMR